MQVERKVEKLVSYTYIFNNIFHLEKTVKLGDHRSKFGGEKEKKNKKTFKQTVVEAKGQNQDAPNKFKVQLRKRGSRYHWCTVVSQHFSILFFFFNLNF